MEKKGTAIPVTDRGGPKGCETSRLPHFLKNWLTDGGEVFILTPFTRREIAGIHFWYRPSQLQGHTGVSRVRSIEKPIDLIKNRIRDLPACSLVPQPTTLPRVSEEIDMDLK
jgi:hypothetical protein